MIPGPSIFQRTRRPLNLLAGGIFLALTLAYGSAYVRDRLKTKLAQDQSQLEAQKQILSQKQLDLTTIKTNIVHFEDLKRQGMVGIADREGWVEQLSASLEKLKLTDTLSYILKPPQSMTDSPSPDPGTGETITAGPDAAAQHDLDFELRGITEPELLDLLQSYKSQVHGSFRIQACRLTSPSQDGLGAQCTLRFFNLPIMVESQ